MHRHRDAFHLFPEDLGESEEGCVLPEEGSLKKAPLLEEAKSQKETTMYLSDKWDGTMCWDVPFRTRTHTHTLSIF